MSTLNGGPFGQGFAEVLATLTKQHNLTSILVSDLASTTSGRIPVEGLANALSPTVLTVSGDLPPRKVDSVVSDCDVVCLCLETVAELPGPSWNRTANILAAWRDQCSYPIWAILLAPADVDFRPEMRALGFTPLAEPKRWSKEDARCQQTLHFFGHTLHGYKAVPQWLNSRFWAHPDRWDVDPDA